MPQFILNHPVIHIEHGIGRYQGLTKIKTDSIQSEYLIISYLEGDKLYVPVSYLHLVIPYNETSIDDAPLHKLGGEEWNKEKQKISKLLHDHAAELLHIHAKRKIKTGFSFIIDNKKYQNFCNFCKFKLTVDQEYVVKSVLEDMQSSQPMDRLICGDVGFGKTEIAMRAAFLCALNKKQVAILVPTTLLAQQHYQSFTNRFSQECIVINIISRFQNTKEQKNILHHIKTGLINILIGTHKILLKTIQWHNLGLLIIDEEHRFGVQHKEIIKKNYSNIDILTLTATPIPRTLKMAMTGIKDLSIINNPPLKRLAIKTFVQEYNPMLIRKTILHEISRGGQVYYIYNKVKNITRVETKLKKLIPEAKIKIGHGRMHNSDLKQVMHEFHENEFNVLICTTIMESGIDIPSVNTIIIENSDHFGLSQLHQLRGRIGRSSQQAYALLLVNSFKTLTIDAKKRLNFISSVNNFGGGFSLSNEDISIRGAGELLGKKQSGHIKNIGLSLYIKLLKNSVKLLKNKKQISFDTLMKKYVEIDLRISALFPEFYISDVNTRLFFYTKISNAKNIEKIEKIKYELISRFGMLPILSKNLLHIAKIRFMANKIGIKSIKSNKNIGLIKFNNVQLTTVKRLLETIKKKPNIWKMKNSTTLKFIWQTDNDVLRLKWIKKFLEKIQE